MAEFAKSYAGPLSVVGTVLGGSALLNNANNGCGNNGILGGLFGGNGNSDGSNCHITRYEQAQFSKIAELETQISLRDANIFTDQKLNDFRNYVDGRFAVVNERLNSVDVYAATNTATISCMQAEIAKLQGLSKLVIPNDSVCPGFGITLACLCGNT